MVYLKLENKKRWLNGATKADYSEEKKGG